MLVLTRQIGKALRIGNDILLTIQNVQGNQVRIGVDAPKEIGVHREEIYQRIQQDKQAESQPPTLQKVSQTNGAVGQTVSRALRYFSTDGAQSTPQKTPTITFKKKRPVLSD